MSKTIVSQSLDFEKNKVYNSKYHLTQVSQETGNTFVTLTPSSNPVSKFIIPPNVVNFSKSILTFDVDPQLENTDALSMYADNVPFIRSMSLYVSGGAELMEINDVHKWTNIIFRRRNRPEVVSTWDDPEPGPSTGDGATNTNAVSKSNGFYEGLIHKNIMYSSSTSTSTSTSTPIVIAGSDEAAAITAGARALTVAGNALTLADTATAAYADIRSTTTTVTTTNTTSNNGVIRPNGELAHTIDEPAYLITSTEAPALRGPYLRVRLPLSLFSDTILSLDKGIYFGKNLTLSITWNTTKAISWKHTAVNDVVTGAAEADKNIVINELYLFTAIEQNQMILDQMLESYKSGYKFLVPYTVGVYQNLNGRNVTLTMRYDDNYGDKIKRIYIAPFDTTNGLNLTLSHPNQSSADPPVIGSVIENFYTTINGKRRQEFNLNCLTGQDYYVNRHLVKGSCIDSRDSYYYNWVHEENFLLDTPVGTNTDNHDDGLIIDLPIKYDFIAQHATAGTTKDYYVFTVFQRELMIQPGLIDFVRKSS